MELKYLLENLIFASGEPLSIKKISQILEIEEGEINVALTELKTELNDRGLRLTEKDGKIQMTTAPEAGKYIEKFVSSQLKEDLSDAALETLAAVSYLGPITKQELED
jgi:segregation and condensation protein B